MPRVLALRVTVRVFSPPSVSQAYERTAARNRVFMTIVPDLKCYRAIIAELDRSGNIGSAIRKKPAVDTFALTRATTQPLPGTSGRSPWSQRI